MRTRTACSASFGPIARAASSPVAPSGSSSSDESGRTTFIVAKDIRVVACVLCALALPTAACASDSPESEPKGGAALDAEVLQELAPGKLDPIIIERYELRDPGLAKPARRPAFRLAVDAFAAEPGVHRVEVEGLRGA